MAAHQQKKKMENPSAPFLFLSQVSTDRRRPIKKLTRSCNLPSVDHSGWRPKLPKLSRTHDGPRIREKRIVSRARPDAAASEQTVCRRADPHTMRRWRTRWASDGAEPDGRTPPSLCLLAWLFVGSVCFPYPPAPPNLAGAVPVGGEEEGKGGVVKRGGNSRNKGKEGCDGEGENATDFSSLSDAVGLCRR